MRLFPFADGDGVRDLAEGAVDDLEDGIQSSVPADDRLVEENGVDTADVEVGLPRRDGCQTDRRQSRARMRRRTRTPRVDLLVTSGASITSPADSLDPWRRATSDTRRAPLFRPGPSSETTPATS
jgi:hypothetical protein